MSKEQMAADTAQQAGTPAIDWPAFDRLARRVAVAKAVMFPVEVAFHPDGDKSKTVMGTWQGQVYGSLAVCQVGQTPPRCEAVYGWYQLIHVPTGLWLRAHKRAHPLRVLALALNDTGIDWAAMGSRGLGEVSSEQREAAQGVVRGWGERYGV